jgi:hypothetical protein
LGKKVPGKSAVQLRATTFFAKKRKVPTDPGAEKPVESGVSQLGTNEKGIFADLEVAMVIGAHLVIYSKDADADRAFFRDVLGFGWVDAGQGWLIFALPGAEVAALEKKGASFGEIREERWGRRTSVLLPGGGEIGLYEPKHPLAFEKKN